MSSLRKINRVIKRRNDKIELERLAAEREKRMEEHREKVRKEREESDKRSSMTDLSKTNYSPGIFGKSLAFPLVAAAILGSTNK